MNVKAERRKVKNIKTMFCYEGMFYVAGLIVRGITLMWRGEGHSELTQLHEEREREMFSSGPHSRAFKY